MSVLEVGQWQAITRILENTPDFILEMEMTRRGEFG